MIDISLTTAPKSDQMNAEDLLQPRTIRIRDVTMKLNEDQPISIFYDGDNGRPYKPCKSMRRVLARVWGCDASKFAGRSLTLFCDPNVMFGGAKVGGIRISNMSGIDKPVTLALTATRGSRKPYTVQPLKSAPVPPADQSAEGAAASVVDAAALMDGIDRCETLSALTEWRDEKLPAARRLDEGAWNMIKAAYLRRKAELADGEAA